MDKWIARIGEAKIPIAAVWLAIGLFSLFFMPSLQSVVGRTEQRFLPDSAESVVASSILERLNPTETVRSSAIVALSRESKLETRDLDWLRKLSVRLETDKESLGIAGVLSATSHPELAERFLSEDGTTAIAVVNLPAMDFDDAALHAIERIRAAMTEVPEGSRAELTGTAPIAQDFQASSKRGLERTEWITALLVLLILFAVFRSWLAPFVGLITIGISVIVSRGIIAAAAGFGLTVSHFTESFLIAVLFGAGTDYCILMIQRYREEMALGGDGVAALTRTMRGIGSTIAYASGTVFVAFLLIGFAEFGLYRSAVGVSIGVLVTLAAGLTLTPALILLFGRGMLSSAVRSGSGSRGSRLWERCASAASKRPLAILLAAVVAIVAIGLSFENRRTYDDVSEMDPGLDSVAGFRQVQKAFGAGEVFPVTMAVSTTASMLSPSGLAALEQASSELSRVEGVAKIRSAVRPLGRKWTDSDKQLSPPTPRMLERQREFARGLKDFAFSVIPLGQGAFGALPAVKPLIDSLRPLLADFLEAAPQLSDLRKLLGPGSGNGSRNGADKLSPSAKGLRQSLDYYISEDGKTTKFELVPSDNPYSSSAMDTVREAEKKLRDVLEASALENPVVYATGTTAKYDELKDLSVADFARTGSLVLAGIALLLLLLLRSFAVPLYVLLSLCMNYALTMSLTEILYVRILGYEGLTWSAAFFIFLVIVALGVDYGIFLMARYKEEHRPGKASSEAMTSAMLATGGVIGASAAIMGGTFGALSFSGVGALAQIGIGTMIGLILYATVFMTFVLPAFVFLFEGRKGRLLPRKKPR